MASDVAGITILMAKLAIAIDAVKGFTRRITEIEEDVQMPANDKLSQIREIRKELNKVGVEIDTIKTDVRLLNTYRVN